MDLPPKDASLLQDMFRFAYKFFMKKDGHTIYFDFGNGMQCELDLNKLSKFVRYVVRHDTGWTILDNE